MGADANHRRETQLPAGDDFGQEAGRHGKGQDDAASVKLSDYFQVGQDAAQTQCSG